jgi:hypothetical protein
MLPLAVGEIATWHVKQKIGLNQKQSDTNLCETRRLDAVNYCTVEQTSRRRRYTNMPIRTSRLSFR